MSTRHFVLASCGHWWHESGPDGMKLTTPRVCTDRHGPGVLSPIWRPPITGVVGTSPQGLAMVHVVYVSHDGVTQPAYEHWPEHTHRWDVDAGRADPRWHLDECGTGDGDG